MGVQKITRRNADVQLAILSTQLEALLGKTDVHMKQTELLSKRLSTLEDEYKKYKIFFGGAMFATSALWLFAVFMWNNFKGALQRFFAG